jgi:Zn-dependent protease with chaperone function
MMFYVFGAAVVLATFAAVNAVASIAVMVVAPAAKGALDRTRASASTRTRALLALRLAPSAAAAAVATFLVLPAYMLFEPAQAGEHVTLPLALLAAGALALALHGLVRGIRALRATSAIERRWKARSEPFADAQSSVPVFRVRDAFPVFTVVGLRRPSLYVSDRVLDALAPSEIAAAMAHERSHLDTRDNVKRLLLRTCPDLVAFFPLSRTIEQEWAQAAEMLADERAAGDAGRPRSPWPRDW